MQRIGGTAQFRRSQIPVLPAVLGPAVRFPYGAFQLKARITKGAQYEIQATTDLQHWQTICTDTAEHEAIEYVDSDASKFSCRFYRILAGIVQSANVMGYASTTLPPGFSMIANPFDAPSNFISDLLKDMPDGTKINKFDTRFFQMTENVFRGGKWSNPSEKLVPGEGAILHNPTSDYKTLSFVGDVMQGNLSIPIAGGFSIRSSLVPQAGRLHTDLAFPIAEGDVIHLFDRDRQKYVLYPYDAAAWASNPPIVSVSESFWVAKTSPGNWTRNFILNT
ncbi:MAG: hypothetical protein JWQ71_1960 [Pedosphaera sp.]|nr:hypothetical protein [Pedosphaera sp.]